MLNCVRLYFIERHQHAAQRRTLRHPLIYYSTIAQTTFNLLRPPFSFTLFVSFILNFSDFFFFIVYFSFYSYCSAELSVCVNHR